MTGKTHMLGGIVLGTLTLTTLDIDVSPVLYYGFCAFGALLPDIDHQHSLLGRVTLFVPHLINLKWSHRTITHSLLFLILTMLIAIMLTSNYSILLGLFIGVLSHLILDSLNPTGVPWLYPFNKKKFRVLKVRTGTKDESLVVFAFVVIMCLIVFPIDFGNIFTSMIDHSKNLTQKT